MVNRSHGECITELDGHRLRPRLIHYDYKKTGRPLSRVALTEHRTAVWGIGTDIVEIGRFREIPPDAPFFMRTFTRHEIEYCRGFADPAPHLAATFAAKEAIFKALANSGARPPTSMRDLEVRRTAGGVPIIVVAGRPAKDIRVSLSHCRAHAAAVCLVAGAAPEDVQETLDGAVGQILSGVRKTE